MYGGCPASPRTSITSPCRSGSPTWWPRTAIWSPGLACMTPPLGCGSMTILGLRRRSYAELVAGEVAGVGAAGTALPGGGPDRHDGPLSEQHVQRRQKRLQVL